MRGEVESEEIDQIVEGLDAAILEAKEKIESGRVYDVENERIRIDWIRALTEAARARQELLKAKRGDA